MNNNLSEKDKINHAWWHLVAIKGKLKIYIDRVECQPAALCDINIDDLFCLSELIEQAKEIKERDVCNTI